MHDLAQPIVLDGREHIDYVPTQVITEYLRFHPVLDLDGIRFRSAQNAGVNYVLFLDDSGCANVADASPSAVLHFVEGSRQVVRVVATAASR